MPTATSTSSINAAYSAALPEWERIRDCVAGQRAVKAKTTTYLPEFVPVNPDRYTAYINRASFMNFTGFTVEKLTGAAFNESPEDVLPDQIDFMLEDADGAQGDLEQIAKRGVSNVTQVGRHGFLTDYQTAEPNLTQEQVRQRQLRPFIRQYPAESIIDWDSTNGKLTLVRLKEVVSKRSADRLTVDDEEWWRELYIDPDTQNYTIQMYKEQVKVGEPIVPLYGGKPFKEIPFVISGSVDNLPDVDKPTMIDVANINITHYQVSASWAENLFVHGQLTLGIATEMSTEAFNEQNKNGVAVGATSGHFLGPGGNFVTATAPESSSLDKARNDLAADATAIGASLINPSMANTSATAATISATAQASVMQTIVGNVSDALERCLRWAYMFQTGSEPVEGSIKYQINDDFFDQTVDAQIVQLVLQMRDRGLITDDEINSVKKRIFELMGVEFDEMAIDQAGDNPPPDVTG